MAIRGILYDNDGTLVDTHDLILSSMRYATRAVLGRVLPDERLMAKVGTPLDDQLLDFADGDAQLGDELQRVYREHNHAHHDGEVKAFAGVVDGLVELHAAGFKMGVVTAKRHWLAQRGLEIVGAWPYLDCLVGADDCPNSKPLPDPIIMAASRLGLAPDECIYLGDSPFDVQAGKAAGCMTVAALWGMFSADILAAELPDSACASFADFVDFAESLADAEESAPSQQGAGRLEFVLIRHGQTPGNAQKRYVGVLDQPLSEAGREEARSVGAHPAVSRVYVSTLRRTHETAAIMFPDAEQVVVDGIQEMDFGEFSGRTADEMEDDPAYRSWVDGWCEGRCPGGESQTELTDRVCAALEDLLRAAAARGERRVVMVGHGGTMMASLSRFADDGRAYWEWLVGNCGGYRIQVDLGEGELRFSKVELLDYDSL